MKSNRFRRIAVVLCLCFMFQMMHAQESSSVTGVWRGILALPQAKLRLSVTIHQGDDGGLTGTFNSIDQGSGEMPLDEVTFKGDILSIRLNKIDMSISQAH